MIRRANEDDFTFRGSYSGPATFDVSDLERNLVSSERERQELRQVRASEKVPLDEKKFRKVAFDLYQSRDEDDKGIWKVQEDEGKKFLVRTQPEFFEEREAGATAPEMMKLGNWTVSYDTEREGVVLAYRGQPLRGFLAQKYQFDRSSAQDFMKFLLRKASTSVSLVQELSPKMPAETIESMMKSLDLTKANDKSVFTCLKAELKRREITAGLESCLGQAMLNLGYQTSEWEMKGNVLVVSRFQTHVTQGDEYEALARQLQPDFNAKFNGVGLVFNPVTKPVAVTTPSHSTQTISNL